MARTRWPPDLATPASGPGQADQTGSAGGCQKEPGPGRQVDPKTTSGVSRLAGQAGPRSPTLRPNHSKTSEAGPEHYPHPPCRFGATEFFLDLTLDGAPIISSGAIRR